MLLLALPVKARAEVTQKDLEILANLLGFTIPPIAGVVDLGIVYNPESQDSTTEMKKINSFLGNGLEINDVTLVPVPVDIRSLKYSRVNVYFMTSGLDGDSIDAGNFIKEKRLLCVTTDFSQMAAGNCTLSIESEPRVKITVSKMVEEETGADFDPAFRLMISEN